MQGWLHLFYIYAGLVTSVLYAGLVTSVLYAGLVTSVLYSGLVTSVLYAGLVTSVLYSGLVTSVPLVEHKPNCSRYSTTTHLPEGKHQNPPPLIPVKNIGSVLVEDG